MSEQKRPEVRIQLENLERSGWNEQMDLHINVDKFLRGHQQPLTSVP